MIECVDRSIEDFACPILCPAIIEKFFFEIRGSASDIDFLLFHYLDSKENRIRSFDRTLDVIPCAMYLLDTLWLGRVTHDDG